MAIGDNLVIRLVLNASQFSAELDKEKAKLEELNAKHIDDKTIHVDIDDAEARARIAEDTRPEDKVIHIRTEGDERDRMGLGVASLLTALPMITPLLATAAAGVMGLASAFASAAVGVGGFAAVAVPTLKNIFDATKNAQKAQEEYNKATTNKERQAALKKEQEAWAGLDAQERQAARALMSFQSFWAGFRKSFETPVLNMFTNGLKMLQQLLTDLRPVINAAGQALTQLEKEAAKALGSPFWKQFFNYLGGTAKQSIITFGEAIGNLIKGFAALLMAFQPLSTDMANGLLRLSQRFAQWATQLSSSSGFHQFINYVRQNGPLVVQLIGQLASIIGKLIVAMAPLGHELLQIALTLAKFINQLLTAHPELAKLIAIVISGSGAFRLLHAAVSPVGPVIKALSNGFSEFSKIIGVLRSSGLPGLISHLRNLSPVVDTIIKGFKNIGPILSGIGRGFTSLGRVIRVFATGVVNVLRTIALALMENPITAIIAIIVAAIVFLVYEIVTHWTQIKQFLEKTWNSIKTTAANVWNGIKSFFSNVWKGIVSTARSMANGVVAAFQWLYNHNYYFQDLVDFIRSAWNTIRSVSLSVWNGIRSFLSSAWNTIRSVAHSVFNSVRSVVQTVWNAIRSVTSSVWHAISGVLSSVWGHIRSIISAGASTIRSVLSSAWNAVRSVASSAWSSIVSVISSAVSRIGSLLSGLASRAFAWGRNLISEFVSGIKSMFGAIADAASSAAHTVARFLGFHSPAEEGPGADADKWAPNLMKMFAQGIEEHTPLVQRALAKAITPPQVMVNPQVHSMIHGVSHAYSMTGSDPAHEHFIYQQNAPLLHIENLHVRNDQDIQKIQQALYNANQRVLRAKGVRTI